jgi:hypothetical protein
MKLCNMITMLCHLEIIRLAYLYAEMPLEP